MIVTSQVKTFILKNESVPGNTTNNTTPKGEADDLPQPEESLLDEGLGNIKELSWNIGGDIIVMNEDVVSQTLSLLDT